MQTIKINVQRRNRITKLLSDWGLIDVCTEDEIIDIAPPNQPERY